MKTRVLYKILYSQPTQEEWEDSKKLIKPENVTKIRQFLYELGAFSAEKKLFGNNQLKNITLYSGASKKLQNHQSELIKINSKYKHLEILDVEIMRNFSKLTFLIKFIGKMFNIKLIEDAVESKLSLLAYKIMVLFGHSNNETALYRIDAFLEANLGVIQLYDLLNSKIRVNPSKINLAYWQSLISNENNVLILKLFYYATEIEATLNKVPMNLNEAMDALLMHCKGLDFPSRLLKYVYLSNMELGRNSSTKINKKIVQMILDENPSPRMLLRFLGGISKEVNLKYFFLSMSEQDKTKYFSSFENFLKFAILLPKDSARFAFVSKYNKINLAAHPHKLIDLLAVLKDEHVVSFLYQNIERDKIKSLRDQKDVWKKLKLVVFKNNEYRDQFYKFLYTQEELEAKEMLSNIKAYIKKYDSSYDFFSETQQDVVLEARCKIPPVMDSHVKTIKLVSHRELDFISAIDDIKSNGIAAYKKNKGLKQNIKTLFFKKSNHTEYLERFSSDMAFHNAFKSQS